MTKRKIECTWLVLGIMVSRPSSSSSSCTSSSSRSLISSPLWPSLSLAMIHSYVVCATLLTFMLLSCCTSSVYAGNSGILNNISNNDSNSSSNNNNNNINNIEYKIPSTTPMNAFASNINNNNNNNQIISNYYASKAFVPSPKFYPKNDTSQQLYNYANLYNNKNNHNINNNISDSVNSNYLKNHLYNRSNDKTENNYNSRGKKSLPSSSSLWSVGNELWDNIITDCYRIPTFSCFQKNVYSYLDKTLDINDVNITNHLKFFRNKVDFTKYTREKNEPKQHSSSSSSSAKTTPHPHFNDYTVAASDSDDDEDDFDNEIPNESRSSHADSPIEEVTNALYGKTIKFAMTHDIEFKLPNIFFDGAIVRISPRSIEGNGALVKLEFVPKQEIEERETGRIFKKQIQQFIKNKILLSFLALILIIKLIKVKIFWLLPLIVGVSTAKKLILKFLLFLFPALAHIFKLCSYYHDVYHTTKYHHHHHLIKHHHHHTVLPPWIHETDHQHHSAILPNGPELIFTDPPKLHPAEYLGHHHAPQVVETLPPISSYESEWETGPGLGSEFINDIHRSAHVDGAYFKPKLDDANEIHSWGLGTTHLPTGTSHSYNINPFLQEPNGFITAQRLKSHGPVYTQKTTSPSLNAAQIAAQYGPQVNQNTMKDIQRAQAQAKEALRIQAEQKLIAQQQKILQQQPFVQDAQPLYPKGYDPFYSPILTKIDKILLQLGFAEEHCKERLICSMYKNPSRYSPHSNFVSAELSRDTSELEKPTSTNAAVIRFYRYVHAARDGQDQRDCLQLYPHCAVKTE